MTTDDSAARRLAGPDAIWDAVFISLMKSAVLLLALVSCALGQVAPTTSLSGTVADPSGSVIPNAALELTNQGTHWSRRAVTDAQGRFQFTLVPPGAYDLGVSASGFTPVRQQGINLDVGSWRSGLPINVTSGQDRSFSGVGLDRGDITGDPFLTSGRPRSQLISAWFNMVCRQIVPHIGTVRGAASGRLLRPAEQSEFQRARIERGQQLDLWQDQQRHRSQDPSALAKGALLTS